MSLIFHEMFFSRLHFSSELTSCEHWWLAWGKWNATWHFVYKLFDVFPQLKHRLSDYVRHEMFIHVYFVLKLLVKRKGWTEAFIQRYFTPHQRASKRHLLFEFHEKSDIIWKMRLCFLSKVTIYKTGSFQWSSIHAVVKTMLYLFGTHVNRTERPVPNIFGTNTCTVTPLVTTAVSMLCSSVNWIWCQKKEEIVW